MEAAEYSQNKLLRAELADKRRHVRSTECVQEDLWKTRMWI